MPCRPGWSEVRAGGRLEWTHSSGWRVLRESRHQNPFRYFVIDPAGKVHYRNGVHGWSQLCGAQNYAEVRSQMPGPALDYQI